MTLVVDKFLSLLPPRSKVSPSGWRSFNAPCCHHRGHSQDKRKRAGVKLDGNGFVYNCFNCKFSTGWQPGSVVGDKLKTLCKWLGAGDDTIKELVFESLKTEASDYDHLDYVNTTEFTEKPLPEASMPVCEWINSEYFVDIVGDIEPIIDYIQLRGFDPLSDNFYWSPAPGYTDRVILPFRYNGKIVGNTARKISEGKPKYLSDQHPHFVYNFDQQIEGQKYLFVCEGPFDALAVGGVALLTNDIAEQQARIINSIGAKVIVIPDQDQAGLILYDRAQDFGWSVARPNWESDVKDCADAVQRYGKLFVVVDAIMSSVDGEIKINMAKKQQQKKFHQG